MLDIRTQMMILVVFGSQQTPQLKLDMEPNPNFMS